ncbi:Glu/Leu/Phe/Val family dehydrogenase [Natribacillus halophilus]|uniref:Glutamate dehydrogenase n=1 Tax=Natribacillus halophilus TaxID=549003 RepID=A0A1G8JEC3_9BACI|nr:Glu/Leu/Phe/Val dehydrogenase [Natribacillus halophilus]SDI29546.1 glutamate dehydrogenase (NAD) [Natribacillus halophilus]
MGENGKQEAAAGEERKEKSRHTFALTQDIIASALQKWGYQTEVYELLKEPLRTLAVRIPIKMDNGETKVFSAFRVQHSDAVGPGIGGVRFHPEVTEKDVQAQAIWASLQAGIIDIPYGGASGAIVCNPMEMSFRELEALSRGYVRALVSFIGTSKDVIAPDAVTNTQVMAWMLDEYSQLKADDTPGFIIGKPVILGGSLGREAAVAKGVAITAKSAAKRLNLPLKGARAVIHGFGNVGTYVAKALEEAGVSIVGISDGHGALHDANGLDVDYLLDRRDSFGMVTNLFKKSISKKELLEVNCDMIIDSSRDTGIITSLSVDTITARLFIETGRHKISQEATARLHEQGTCVIPNLLTSAGNTAISYLEGVQNNQGYYWTEEEVNDKLQEILENALTSVYDLSRKRKVDMHEAAYMTGVQKLAEASRFRGWV